MRTSPEEMTPQTRRWRTGLLTACALSLVFVFFVQFQNSPLLPQWCGDSGLELNVNRATGSYLVTHITPGGPADKAGLQVGDVLLVHGTTFAERWLLRSIRLDVAQTQNVAFTYVVQRGSQQLNATLTPSCEPVTWHAWAVSAYPGSSPFPEWLAWFAQVWALLFAALLAARRPDLAEARLLSMFLIAYFGVDSISGDVVPWWPRLDFVFITAFWAINAFAPSWLFTLFTAEFGQPLSRTRRRITSASLAFTATGTAIGLILWIRWYAFGLPDTWNSFGETIVNLTQLFALICAVAAIVATSDAMRQRIVWATASIAPAWILGAFLRAPVDNQTGFVNQQAFNAARDALNAFSLIVPVGLTYAVLSRRIIDVGYAINRAAVYAVISTIVFGVFVVVEWALGVLVGDLSHATSIVVNVIVALAVGLSIRPIHNRVEYIIDRVFFRKRHEDVSALRRFAQEATFITNSDILLDRTVEEVKDHAELDHVEILLEARDGSYTPARGNGAISSVSENDPAILAMRTSLEPVDLQQYKTVVDGDRAYPLVARGEMLGVLVCGTRSRREPYAPDEADALVRVASGVGVALDTLRDGKSDGLSRLQGTLDEILEQLRAINARINNGGPPAKS